MISNVLIPKLQRRFPSRGLRTDSAAAPCAVFPAIHPEIGEIQIYDDGNELTLVTGNFTHGHFTGGDFSGSDHQTAEKIVDEILSFLEAVFADQIVFWGAHNRGGGWYKLGEGDCNWAAGERKYVWSGPLS